jgi:hypothetical protein
VLYTTTLKKETHPAYKYTYLGVVGVDATVAGRRHPRQNRTSRYEEYAPGGGRGPPSAQPPPAPRNAGLLPPPTWWSGVSEAPQNNNLTINHFLALLENFEQASLAGWEQINFTGVFAFHADGAGQCVLWVVNGEHLCSKINCTHAADDGCRFLNYSGNKSEANPNKGRVIGRLAFPFSLFAQVRLTKCRKRD